MTNRRSIILLSFAILFGVTSLHSATRIMSDKLRNEAIQDLKSLLNYEDEELRSRIPNTVNPFFFEQPLLLKLRAPGGVKDQDILETVGEMLIEEVSGAFVRGSKRYLLMKNGELIKEGDTITEQLESFGGMETTVTVEDIERERFVLKLNKTVLTVDLAVTE